MGKPVPLHLQEIIFSSSNLEISRAVSRIVKNGKPRKIAPKISCQYDTNEYYMEKHINHVKKNNYMLLNII